MNYSSKAVLVALLCAAAVSVSSCKKDKDDDAPAPTPAAQASFKVDGNLITTSTVRISKSTPTRTNIAFIAGAKGLTIDVPDILTSGVVAQARVTYTEGGGGWATTLGGATVNVTAFDATTKKVSGTFSGSLTSTFPPVTTKEVTEGKFTDVQL
jgi:hypothetical protein